MSKLPKNFEKALIGVAGVAALGFAALGFMKSSAVETDFAYQAKGTGKDDPTIPEAEATSKAVGSLTANRAIEQAEDGDRKVDLFTGIPLFANKNAPNTPIDLVKGPMVHAPIENTWWIETGADVTYANSLSRDDDSDGYTNLEEWEAKTHPVDPKSVPPLVKKLAYVKDESTKWYVPFGLESGGKWAPKLLGEAPDKKKFANRVSAVEMLSPGDTFFKDGAMAGRFKFTGIIQKEVVSQRTNSTQTVNVAEYEELKPNKAGIKYQSQAGLPEAEIDANAYFDRIAVLDLQAIGEKGKQFKVEEGTKFALPSGATEKKYLMKKITPTSIEVEFDNDKGEKETLEIPKS